MSISIKVNGCQIQNLDLSPVVAIIEDLLTKEVMAKSEQQLSFELDFPREETDPRELSEIPEVRLWFVRLDALYPWLPFLLNWKEGELARYAAIELPDDAANKKEVQSLARQQINEYISSYRRNGNYGGLKSFTTMQTALNSLAGYYTSYGNRPLPEKLKKRLLQEFKQVQVALKRGL